MMHPRQVRLSLAITTILLAAAVSVTTFLQAADQPINLDENSANGAESKVSTKVLQTYPVRIENTVYNNAAGEAFTFKWPGAGPGRFASFVSAGPGVGTIWTWSTVYQVYSIDSPVTFSPVRSIPVFGAPAGGVVSSPSTDGSFTAPGKSINPGQVTLSSASLSSSLITFFSPEKTVASCGVDCAGGNCEIFLENQTGESVTVKNRQQDCCLEPHQLICEGECKSYLTDPLNCGGCGNVCASDEFCSEGVCEEICPGATLCGEVCIDTTSDPLNCGSCGNACDAEEHCSEGACQPNCDQTVCGTQCIDISSDPLNCGACGNICPSNNICTSGACVRCRAPKPTACNNKCTSLNTDPFNCGACGFVCDFTDCPSSGQGACSQGSSCVCSPGVSATSEQATFSPTPSIFPEPMSSMARSRVASRSSAERWRAGVTGGVAAAAVQEAPVCDLSPIAQVIPDGGRFTQSQTDARFGKEIHTTLTIVKNGETVAQGPCALIVPVTGVDTSGV